MDKKRRILRVAGVLAVALAAGHLVESMKKPVPSASLLTAQSNSADSKTPEAILASTGLPLSASMASGLRGSDVTDITSVAATTLGGTAAVCTPTLGLTALPDAMLDLRINAPCHRGERIVIRHAGLNFTARVSEDGQVALALPALEADALVTAFFRDAEVVVGSVNVPDVAKTQRFVVQWTAADVFDLRISEGDRIYIATREARNQSGTQKIRTFGDTLVDQPMFAEVYTYPADTDAKVDIVVEVTVTPQVCGREISAETILSSSGLVEVSKIPVKIPACDAAGDILLLKNLAPAMKIAAAN
jgi:hypothetical protein